MTKMRPYALLALLLSAGCGGHPASTPPEDARDVAEADERETDTGDTGEAPEAVDIPSEADASDPGDGDDPADEEGPSCGPSTCDGCCDGAACAPGSEGEACGAGGRPCVDCASYDMVCNASAMCVNASRLASGMVDDSSLHARSVEDALALRDNLIRVIWGDGGFPRDRMPDTVTPDVPSPLATPLDGLARVDRLDITMDLGFVSHVYLFRPAEGPVGLAVFHQGHSHTLDENGGLTTIQFFLSRGFAVLASLMPLMGPNTGPAGSHDGIIAMASPDLPYSPVKFFLEPVAVALAYARADLGFEDVSMIGISGGGWTTTLYAAVDPTVRLSFPVAGSLPLYLRVGGDIGDAEQYVESIYAVAGYLDLYLLGAMEEGRTQVQILNVSDPCCFSGDRYCEYEDAVRSTLASMGGGDYRGWLDETHASHLISQHALDAVVVYEVEGGSVRIVDNTVSRCDGFSADGGWTSWTFGYGIDLLSAPAGAGDAVARWVFDVPAGLYDVYATWTENANRATDAPYAIEGVLAEPVRLNQELAPDDFLTQDAVPWESLGGPFRLAGGTLTISLSNSADEYVIADAVLVRRVGD
jgi:hypothetical protein